MKYIILASTRSLHMEISIARLQINSITHPENITSDASMLLKSRMAWQVLNYLLNFDEIQYLILATNIPYSEANIFVIHSLHIKTWKIETIQK